MTDVLASYGSFYVQFHCAQDMNSEFLTINLLISEYLLYALHMSK